MENRYKRAIKARQVKKDGYSPIDFEKEQRKTLLIQILGTLCVCTIIGLTLISIFVTNAYYSIVPMLTYLLGFFSKEILGIFRKE